MKYNRIEKVVSLDNGKSKPKKITISFKKNGKSFEQYFILKQTDHYVYLVESSVANFFKHSNMIDKEVTYSIMHLSKCTVLI